MDLSQLVFQLVALSDSEMIFRNGRKDSCSKEQGEMSLTVGEMS